MREETCRRRVYAGTGQTQVEFLEVTLNGRRVDGRNRERLIAALRRKGLVQDEAMMPFFRDTKHVYRYELLGEDTCLERSAWVLGFMPVRKSQQTVEGWAFIDKENYDVLAMEFRPAKLPWVCAGTKMKLWCARVDGMMLPVYFEMDMDIRVKLLLALAERKLRIEDRYSEYSFCGKEQWR